MDTGADLELRARVSGGAQLRGSARVVGVMRHCVWIFPLWAGLACTDDVAGPVVGDVGGAATSADGGGTTDDGAADAGAADAAQPVVEVVGGTVHGLTPSGGTGHLYARFDPRREVFRDWTGDAAGVERSDDWSTAWTVSPEGGRLVARTDDVAFQAETVMVQGVAREKRVRLLAPTGRPVRAVLGLFHGTGGSGAFIERTEAHAFALRFVYAGYLVFATDAEEVDGGDTNQDGYIRWNAGINAVETNVDFGNVTRIEAALRQRFGLDAELPFVAVGMSNGGSFSISAASALGWKAAISYCAQGRRGAAETTRTPTAWFMCGQEDNEQVSNALAQSYAEDLRRRGVPTMYVEHPATPMSTTRFLRESGVDERLAEALLDDLRRNALVDDVGNFLVDATTLRERISEAPAGYPAIVGVPQELRRRLFDQMQISIAAHKFYADWVVRTIRFVDELPQ